MIQGMSNNNQPVNDFYIEVINHASFNSYFTVSYSYNNSNFSFNSAVLAPTDLDKIVVSKNATNIVLTLYLVTQAGQTNTLYTKTFPTPTTLKLLLTGTETAPIYTDITNSSGSNPTPPINYYISVSNTAPFIGKVFVKYTLNKRNFSDSSDSISMNHTATLRIPSSATNIQITVQVRDKNNPWATIYTNTLAVAAILKLSLSGTISAPVCADITSQDTSGSLPTLADGAVTVSNHGAFTAQFSLNFDLADYNVTDVSNNIDNGQSISIPVPSDAQNTQLDIELLDVDGSWFSIYQDTFNTAPTVALDLTGTLSAPVVTDVTTNPPSVGDGVPVMQLTKDPDKTVYNVGDTVKFTIDISNISGSTASSVMLNDNIPTGSSFVASSLTLDGVSVSGVNFLNNGLMIGDMNSGDSHTVTYKIVVNILPYPNPVENDPVINYDYLDSTGANQIGTLTGTTTPFTVVSGGNNNVTPMMKLTKNPDQNSYNVGDTVTFTIVVMNKRGRTASSVMLKDIVPSIATFIPSSLTLDGNSISGTSFINNGLSLGNMPKGVSHTITYQMTINSMPSSNPVENDPTISYKYVNYSGVTQQGSMKGATAPFTVSQGGNGNGSGNPDMDLTKDPDQISYNVGDIVTFTIGISNLDGEYASDVVLTDNVPDEATFITSSLMLDGVSVDGTNFLDNGLSLGDMAIGDSHTVNYEMSIDSTPATNPVENDPVINYDYLDSTGATQIGTLAGTTTPFTVLPGGVGSNGSPVIQFTKVPDQASYNIGAIVTFTMNITLTDGGDASNIILTDNIPNEASFIPSSLNLDGTTVDGTNFLVNGLDIIDMSVGDSHTVSYQMIINSMPNPNPVENDPVINYDYLDVTGSNQIGTLTGKATPFTVTQNGGGICGCCCCCPCMCNPQSSSSSMNSEYYKQYIEYLKSLGYM